MRHALILSIALTAFAGAAQAQTRPPANGQAAGLRYLTWAGKAEAPAPVLDAPAPSVSQLRPATGRTAPPRVIPHAGGMASAPAPAPAPRGLTPANAWLRPAVAAPAAPPVTPIREAVPVTEAAPAADPMAPRRDAAIFRMGRDAEGQAQSQTGPAPVPTVAAASGAPSRYYSVHRQYGRQPDVIERPAPVYLDALPVDLERAPQSEDLAEPPAAPTVLRDANGRVRPAPPSTGDDVQ